MQSFPAGFRNVCKFKVCICVMDTQGNYATQYSSGMCHLMPQRHLPEWREEEEEEGICSKFVHCGSSALNHAITSN